MSKNFRIESGVKSKRDGHQFEHTVAEYLESLLNIPFIVKGQSNTKIDVLSADASLRFSIKNPKGKNTQVALLTQSSFIEAMKIEEDCLKLFISQFFGGQEYSSYSRHRMKRSEISDILNQKFLKFLNLNKENLFNLLIVQGRNKTDTVNYFACARKKNIVESIFCIDLIRFFNYYMKGEWFQNETTFEYRISGKKILHLQMKGSGKKYDKGYHSMMFHIYVINIDNKYVINPSNIRGM